MVSFRIGAAKPDNGGRGIPNPLLGRTITLLRRPGEARNQQGNIMIPDTLKYYTLEPETPAVFHDGGWDCPDGENISVRHLQLWPNKGKPEGRKRCERCKEHRRG